MLLELMNFYTEKKLQMAPKKNMENQRTGRKEGRHILFTII